MPRIFLVLAGTSLAGVACAILLGLSLGDFQTSMAELRALQLEAELDSEGDSRVQELEAEYSRASVHRLAGLGAALFTVFASAISATYFIGTSRWCKEVVETYEFDPQITVDALQRKRRAFGLAASNMLAVVVISSLGAAADPSTGVDGTAAWATPHLWAALLGISWLGWSFLSIGGYIGRQHAAIEDIMRLVHERRVSLGLTAG